MALMTESIDPISSWLPASDVADELERALAQDELRIAYQPVINAETGNVSGMEALCRWTSPKIGDVLPSVFVAAAEQHGLIRDLGVWVLHRAMLEAAEIRRRVGRSRLLSTSRRGSCAMAVSCWMRSMRCRPPTMTPKT